MMCTGKAARPATLDFAAGRLSSDSRGFAGASSGHDIEQRTTGQWNPGVDRRRSGVRAATCPTSRWAGSSSSWRGRSMAWRRPGGWSAIPACRTRSSISCYGGLVADVIIILWGLYLLGLAFGRSARFPRHFTIWQIALIVWVLARQAYVLAVPDFVFSARSLGITAIEIGVGLLCIYLLRRGSGAETVYAKPETEAPPVLVSIVAALLGIILGAAVGAVRRLPRRLGDRRCRRGQLFRGRLRLFRRCSSALAGWWSAPSAAACSPSGCVHRRKRKPVGIGEARSSNSRIAIAGRRCALYFSPLPESAGKSPGWPGERS